MPEVNLLSRLVERLLELTDQGKLEWQETASENDFQATVGHYVVSISQAGPISEEADYRIQVSDWRGNVLETATEFREKSPGVLERLFQGARRKALKVDEALADLLSSLDSLQR
jgi:hypothetical protein